MRKIAKGCDPRCPFPKTELCLPGVDEGTTGIADRTRQKKHWYLCSAVAGLALTLPACSDEHCSLSVRPTLNTYGMPGLIDMPSASTLPDGELGTTISHSIVGTRGTLAFQVLPDVTATSRYTGIPDFGIGPGTGLRDVYFDRSVDLH